MQEVCENFILENPNTLFVSIAAGLTIQRLSDFLPANANIVRVMPNTPSAIGMGMSGIYAAPSISSEQVTLVDNIMQSVGKTLIVKNEDHPKVLFSQIRAIEVEHGVTFGLDERIPILIEKHPGCTKHPLWQSNDSKEQL